jgi:transcriptional regulator of acetoin/glycerol metabolism
VEDLHKIRDRQTPSSAIVTVNELELLPLAEVERRHVLHVLEACHGNRTDAAKVLELDRKTLYRRLLRWGVDAGSSTPGSRFERASRVRRKRNAK